MVPPTDATTHPRHLLGARLSDETLAAASGLGSPTRDVPPTALDPGEKAEQPSQGSDFGAADRAGEVIGLGIPAEPADERTPPLSRRAAQKAAIVPIETPYSLTPGMEVKRRPGKGHPPRQLNIQELRANEIWLRADGTREERKYFVASELLRRYAVKLSPDEVWAAVDNAGGRRYRATLRERVRTHALKRLGKQVPAVVEDYLWSRTAAKDQGDYKEVRMAAVDHLDRLGITLKREQQAVQVQTIVLRGKNFDVDTLDEPTPEIETAEIVQEGSDAS